VAHGIDTVQAGIRQAWSGDQTDTYASQALQSAGMSPRAANLTDAAIGTALSLGASAGSSAIRSSEGLVHLTSAANASRIAETSMMVGVNYAGPASNATASALGVTLHTGLAPGRYAAVQIPAIAQAAFTPVRGIGPLSTIQASMGQAYTANGALNLATGSFFRFGANRGQMIIYGVDALFMGARFYEAGRFGKRHRR
jgi:hypothetical protein